LGGKRGGDMSFLDDLVKYCEEKYPEKWKIALDRAKKKYAGMNIMEELQKEEMNLRRREFAFAEVERKFFGELYIDLLKKGDLKNSSGVAKILQETSTGR
jgi:hypothetical protein